MRERKKDTIFATSGREDEWTNGIINTPVYRASTCVFPTYAEMKNRGKHFREQVLFYGRKGTPSQWSLENALKELEGPKAAGCMLYPSGSAAMHGAILSQVQSGDHILITDSAYEPTRDFANFFLKRMGIEATYYDPTIGADINRLMRDNTRCVIVEAPGSLTFEMQDIPAITNVAHDKGATVIMDNTWATALYCRGFDLGVDIVVHAVTKYIGGHSDIMMGAAIANQDCYEDLQTMAFSLAYFASPDDCYLALRGLRTMGVRLKQHESAALKVAQWLENHPAVDRVLHPALPSHPDHALWKRDFTGSTGLFSFVLKQGREADTALMVDQMRYFKMGFSWGGYESLITPNSPERVRSVTKWEANGPTMRVHIGLEDVDDLIEDLNDGLERYAAQF